MPVIELNPFDEHFYNTYIRDEMPHQVIDCHTHIWKKEFLLPEGTFTPTRSALWAAQVADEQPIEDLNESLDILFPGKSMLPVIFPAIETKYDGGLNNNYVSECIRKFGYPGLALTKPDMSPELFESTIRNGGFHGSKPYLNFAPPYIPADEIRIYDFLPKEHLECLDKNGWAAMLHIARPGRLKDPVNLGQLLEIDKTYKNAKVIVAHIGRAYSVEDVGDAMEVLSKTENLLFDITANTNDEVMAMLIQAVGTERIMYGSDLPIFRMRAHRITENGSYVNIVPRGLYGNVSTERTMRETDDPANITIILYEEIAAFLKAARRLRLSEKQIEDVFYRTAARIFRS